MTKKSKVKSTTETTKKPSKNSGKTPKKSTPPAVKSPAPAKQTAGAKSKATPAKKADSKTQVSQYPRHPQNPFRQGSSSYGKVFDILAAHKNGLTRKDLIAEVSKVTGKDIKHAGYDVSVVVSARDSITGPRHKSCKEGFWVKREADHVQLMID